MNKDDQTLHRRTPAQVLVIRDKDDPATDSYFDLLRRAIEGEEQGAANYVPEALGIGIAVREPAPVDSSDVFMEALFNAAIYTVVVELRSHEHSGWSPAHDSIIERADQNIITVQVPGPIVDSSGKIQIGQRPVGTVEPALYPLVTTIAVMETLRRMLRDHLRPAGNAAQACRLFVSHAKADGATLAVAIVDFCARLNTLFANAFTGKMLELFYDAESIRNGENWRKEIINGASNGTLIALRSDVYESRFWCREEYRLAEENRRPIVVADVRGALMSEPGHLMFDSATRVRVSDGNMARIVLHAMAAHLRFLKFRIEVNATRAEPPEAVLPSHPTVTNVHTLPELLAAKAASTDKQATLAIVYPGEPVTDARKNVLETYLEARLERKARLHTMEEWSQS